MLLIALGSLLIVAEGTWGMSTPFYNCTCAAMDTKDYVENETVPLIEKNLNILPSCDQDACKMCQDLCSMLANTTREDPEAGNNFCKDVNKDLENVNVSVFSKTCDHKYKYTGLTFENPTCCTKGLRVQCKVSAK